MGEKVLSRIPVGGTRDKGELLPSLRPVAYSVEASGVS